MGQLESTTPGARGPYAPKHLSDERKALFRAVAANWELVDHQYVILLAAECLMNLREAEQTIKDEGLTYIDRFGSPKIHPLVAERRQLRSALARLLPELNLDLDTVAEGRTDHPVSGTRTRSRYTAQSALPLKDVDALIAIQTEARMVEHFGSLEAAKAAWRKGKPWIIKHTSPHKPCGAQILWDGAELPPQHWLVEKLFGKLTDEHRWLDPTKRGLT